MRRRIGKGDARRGKLLAKICLPVEDFPMATDIVLVFTTLGADADATTFGRTLVDERLAACVNVLPPMVSVYRWKGQVEQDREQQLIIKTTSDRLAPLQARLRQLHPYELPELLVLPVVGGSEPYLAWLRDSVD
jgi:periplasmic divalent cation tolerance protein